MRSEPTRFVCDLLASPGTGTPSRAGKGHRVRPSGQSQSLRQRRSAGPLSSVGSGRAQNEMICATKGAVGPAVRPLRVGVPCGFGLLAGPEWSLRSVTAGYIWAFPGEARYPARSRQAPPPPQTATAPPSATSPASRPRARARSGPGTPAVPARPHLPPSSPARRSPVPAAPGQAPHAHQPPARAGRPARLHAPAPPVPRRTRQPRPGALSPVRPRSWWAPTRFRWPGPCTATLSGAVCAGSNPAGDTGQRHKPEHSDNRGPLGGQACDLRKRSGVPDLAPGRRLENRRRPGKGAAQPYSVITAARPLP
jgi:hypothetical protein